MVLVAQGWSEQDNILKQQVEAKWTPFLRRPLPKLQVLMPRLALVMACCRDCHACGRLRLWCQKIKHRKLVRGHCVLTQHLGTREQPVLLWVIDGDLILQAPYQVYGVAGVFTDQYQPKRVEIAHAARWFGAISSNGLTEFSPRTGLVFSEQVVARVRQMGQWLRVQGSWYQS